MDNKENKKEKTEKQIIGDLGEHFAANYLTSRHFVIKEKNYRKKWGELDIIAEKDSELRFVEVKSVVTRGPVSRVTLLGLLLWRVSCETPYKSNPNSVTRETASRRDETSDYFPEENIHLWKQRRMARAIQTYLLEKCISEDKEWQIDVIAVFLDFSEKRAIIRHLEDVVFDIKVA